MLMDVPRLPDSRHIFLHFHQIHPAPDLPDRIRIRGLDPDLQLDQSRAHASDQRDLLIIQKIRRHLKVEVRDPPVMFFKI